MPKPRLDAVGVTSRDLEKSVAFYTLLGFEFAAIGPDDHHIEPMTDDGEVRLMIDDHELAQSLIGEAPMPPNHAMFAMLCASPADVDTVADQIASAGFTVIKQPWDAFWGQRYATVADPDGYLVDLFCTALGCWRLIRRLDDPLGFYSDAKTVRRISNRVRAEFVGTDMITYPNPVAGNRIYREPEFRVESGEGARQRFLDLLVRQLQRRILAPV